MSRVIQARAAMEGAGVRINRAIGIPELRHLDPFLMLDYFDSDRASDYLAGFPDHPHRGFITLTYMLEGRMEHQDSMGHRGVIGPGDAQWMKAASGVIHSEMPKQIEGRMAGFQLWINLPTKEKMTEPDYQEYTAAAFPSVEVGDASVKVLAGSFGGTAGPIEDPATGVRYLDVSLAAGGVLEIDVAEGDSAFAFVYAGNGQVAGRDVAQRRLVVLDPGTLRLAAGPEELRAIVVSGRPIGEPIVQMGPFVMNTPEEINQAVRDYRAGRLVQAAGA